MSAKFLKSAFRPSDIPESDKPQIATMGRSNVGKSSLINHLAGVKNLARVSAMPGLTQALNLYEFDGRYLLVDLPGYGFSEAARSRGKGFETMIEDYLAGSPRLKLILLIIDGRHELQESDRFVLNQLTEEKLPFVLVFNKVDKFSPSEAKQSMKKISDQYPTITIIPHSIKNNVGFGELRNAIEKAVRKAAS